MIKHHHYHSPLKRGLYSLVLIAVLMTIGTEGMHLLEGMPYLDAFYFMSMIATAQGPILMPHTAAGKLFACLMAFVSVGSVVAALGFLFGPFLGKLWRVGVIKMEEEIEKRSFDSQTLFCPLFLGHAVGRFGPAGDGHGPVVAFKNGPDDPAGRGPARGCFFVHVLRPGVHVL